jgi:hypothetical protein
MSIVLPSTEPFDVPRAPLWGVGQCALQSGVVDVPITWDEIERDAEWLTDQLAEYGIARGDVVVIAAGPAEVTWAHPMQMAISRLDGVFAMAWATRFDARRVGALARNLRPKLIVGIDASVVEGLAEIPGGVVGEIGAVRHVLARADAHPALEAAGVRPMLFDLVGPATVVETPDRTGARVDGAEWRIEQDDGALVVTTVGDRGLRLDATPTAQHGSVLAGGDAPGGARLVIDPVAR